MTAPVVGAAYVEVHAKAAASLQREIQVDVDRAASRVQTHRESIGLAPRGEGAFERSQSPEKLAAAAALQERIAASRVAGEDKVKKKVQETGETVERTNTRTVASQERATSSLGRTAAAATVVTAAVSVLTSTVGAYLKAGDEGTLRGEEEIRRYRQLSNGLADLSDAYDRAKVALGGFIAENVNPAGDDFRKGVLALRNPLDTLSAFLGRSTTGSRELAAAFADIDSENPSETVAETARALERLNEQAERSAASLEQRSEAMVRAVGVQIEQVSADERVWRAQEKVNEARVEGARDARDLADAERAIREARQAAADAAQNAIERDRAVAEARRQLRIAQFEQGAGSQAALDAADALQEAEFGAVRAHEEAGDAVQDVAKAERDATDVRVRQTERLADAQKALDDAIRASAKTNGDLRVAQREATGETLNATEKLAIYLEELNKFPGAGQAVRTEIDLLKKAFESLPSRTGLDPATEALLAALGPVYGQGYAPGVPGLTAPAAGFVDPGAPSPITLAPPPPVSITNIFNTPVDPAQITREQAYQIGGGSTPPRMVR